MQRAGEKSQMTWIALASGVLGVVAAFLLFWMIFLSVGLGIVAVVLGVVVLRRSGNDVGGKLAAAAVALGVVAILGTAGSIVVSSGGEDYGRKCALDPSDSDC